MKPTGPTIAIIGISGYAKLISDAIQRVLQRTSGTLVAATVINAREEAEACLALENRGCRIFTDYRDMLNALHGKLDLCIIPTSIHWHMPMTLDALAAGAHVLVEKPLAGSVADGRAIVEAGRIHGKTVAVGFQNMYSPEVWEMKDFLLSGGIGEVDSIQLEGSWPRDRAYYTRNRWAGRTHCDGRAVFDSPLNNAFAHFVNLGLFFAASKRNDAAVLENVSGQLMRHFPIETFDTAHLHLVTDEGRTIDCTLTHADPQLRQPSLRIHGSRGELVWSHDRDSIASAPDGRELRRWIYKPTLCTREQMLSQILDALHHGTPVLCPASLAQRHVEAIERINLALPITAGNCEQGYEVTGHDGWSPVAGLFAELTETASVRE